MRSLPWHLALVRAHLRAATQRPHPSPTCPTRKQSTLLASTTRLLSPLSYLGGLHPALNRVVASLCSDGYRPPTRLLSPQPPLQLTHPPLPLTFLASDSSFDPMNRTKRELSELSDLSSLAGDADDQASRTAEEGLPLGPKQDASRTSSPTLSFLFA